MAEYDLYQIGYKDAMNEEEPFSDLNDLYMEGYSAGTWDRLAELSGEK